MKKNKWNRKLGTSKASQGFETRTQEDAEHERFIPHGAKHGCGKLTADRQSTFDAMLQKKLSKIIVPLKKGDKE